jgi:site-specific DNA recombinase
MKPTTTVRYIGYARKSSEDGKRQIASIDDQKTSIQKMVEQNGLPSVNQILEEAMSAKAPGRPVFTEMVRLIEASKVNGILCWDLDRLFRNPIDGGTIRWLLSQGKIAEIRTPFRTFTKDDAGLLMSIEEGRSTEYVLRLSHNVKRGMMSKAERGWLPGQAPTGYRNTYCPLTGAKTIEKHPDIFPLVRKMWETMLLGTHTITSLERFMNEETDFQNVYGKPIGRSLVYHILTNHFYYSEFEYPVGTGTWHKGKHEPMVTLEEFEQVQRILRHPLKPRNLNQFFPFTGMIICGECGSSITAETKTKTQKNGVVRKYTYYHCTKRKKGASSCGQKCLRSEELETQIADAMKWLKYLNKEEMSTVKESQSRIHRESVRITERLKNLVDLRADGEIDATLFQEKKQELEKERDRLNRLLKNTDNATDTWLEKAEDLFVFLETAYGVFAKGSDRTKKEIVAALGSNLVLIDKKLCISLPDTFKSVIRLKETKAALNLLFEPHESTSNTEYFSETQAVHPCWLRRSGQNRTPTYPV